MTDGGKGYLWRSTKDVANGFSRTAEARVKERADDEYRRLLYVGMTRAEDRLIVCGYHGKRARNPATWHSIVSRRSDRHRRDRGAGASGDRRGGPPLPQQGLAAGGGRGAGCSGRPRSRMRRFRSSSRCLLEDDLPRPLSPSGASLLIEDAREPVVSDRSPVLDGEEEPGLRWRAARRSTNCCRCCPTCRRSRARRPRFAISGGPFRTGRRPSGGGVVAGGGHSRIA